MCSPVGYSARVASTRSRCSGDATGSAAMKLSDLLRAVSALAETGGSGKQYEILAREAEALADMVGWANGPIDPGGQWLERLATLQDDLQVRYAETREPAITILNDRLTGLGRAIMRHDTDLEKRETDGDDGEDFD